MISKCLCLEKKKPLVHYVSVMKSTEWLFIKETFHFWLAIYNPVPNSHLKVGRYMNICLGFGMCVDRRNDRRWSLDFFFEFCKTLLSVWNLYSKWISVHICWLNVKHTPSCVFTGQRTCISLVHPFFGVCLGFGKHWTIFNKLSVF